MRVAERLRPGLRPTEKSAALMRKLREPVSSNARRLIASLRFVMRKIKLNE